MALHGLSRTELDKVESKDFALGKGPLRPRDAGTLILLDRSGSGPKVLMGRRSMRHAFMPGRYVFPGGRTDPADSRVAVASHLDPAVEARLVGTGSRASAARARAIAMSAVRETYEEAGLLLGTRGDFITTKPDWQGFADHGVRPSLANLRYVARAITPPGRVRRFDTRFLAAWRDDVAVSLPDGGPTHELEELLWLPLGEAIEAEVPMITKTILEELAARLRDDPELDPKTPIPFFRMLNKRMVRELV